jgi:EpsI family protein
MRMPARVAVIVSCLVLAYVAVARADRYETPPPRASFDAFPMQFSGWQGRQQAAFTKSVLDVLGLNDYLTRGYSSPEAGGAVDLYVGYWQSQRQGDTIHSPQNCLPGSGWEPLSQTIMSIPDPREPSTLLPMNRNVIQKGLDRELVFYWYQSHGRIIASEYWSKFYLIADAVRMNRTDGAIVRVITGIAGDSPEAEQRAQTVALRFINDLLPQLDSYLPK